MARRLPAAQKFIVERQLNERMGPSEGDLGIIVQGGLFNVLNGRLELAGLSDVYGSVSLPLLVLNVVHPLVPQEIAGFCAGKKAVLIVEEGGPDFIEQAVGQILRKVRPCHQAARQRRLADGRRIYPGGGRQWARRFSAPLCFKRRRRSSIGSARSMPGARRLTACSALPCPRARRRSAPAARSARCFRP